MLQAGGCSGGRGVWYFSWTVIFSGCARRAEGEPPLGWVKANTTGMCNLEGVLELGAGVNLLAEVRSPSRGLQKACRPWNLTCTGRVVEGELLAAIAFDPAIGAEYRLSL